MPNKSNALLPAPAQTLPLHSAEMAQVLCQVNSPPIFRSPLQATPPVAPRPHPRTAVVSFGVVSKSTCNRPPLQDKGTAPLWQVPTASPRGMLGPSPRPRRDF